MKIIDLLKFSAQRKPDTIAVNDESIELGYSRLFTDALYLADILRLNGCKEGVKVAIVLGNCAEYLLSFYAISAAGGTIVPLTTKMTLYEIFKSVERSDVSIVLTNDSYSEKLLQYPSCPANISVISIDYRNSRLCTETLKLGDIRLDNQNPDVALMVFTSGTSGLSKIVMLTNDQLISNMFTYKSLMGFGEHNIVYCSLSLHHIYSICAQVLTHISLADTFIAYDKPFFIKDFFKAVEKYKVTISAFVPFMAMLMAEYPEPDKFNLNSLKYITLSGAKTPKKTYETLVKKYKHVQFINTYGMSEAGSRISIAAPEPWKFPVESVGKPMPGIKVRIADENDSSLPSDTVGEVQVKSSGVMKGYYKNNSLTNQTFFDGWLKTGDLGKLDADGNLFLVGRKKDIIISGGDKIYPLEIEECLLEHPSILDAAAVGCADEKLQEVPYAIVALKSEHYVSSLELINFCKHRLSSYKVPREIIFIKEIPRLGTSKFDRLKLREIADNKTKDKL